MLSIALISDRHHSVPVDTIIIIIPFIRGEVTWVATAASRCKQCRADWKDIFRPVTRHMEFMKETDLSMMRNEVVTTAV